MADGLFEVRIRRRYLRVGRLLVFKALAGRNGWGVVREGCLATYLSLGRLQIGWRKP